MAQLTNRNMTLEITFEWSNERYLGYTVKFLCRGMPVINPNIRPQAKASDGFPTDDHGLDYLIPTLERALETGEMAGWEPIDPDMVIEVYPNMALPFSRDAEREVVEPKPKLPGDLFTVLAMIDSSTFIDGGGAGSLQGPSLVLCVDRRELEAFVGQLKAEFEAGDAIHHYTDNFTD